jgi:hypothetical protein
MHYKTFIERYNSFGKVEVPSEYHSSITGKMVGK